MMEFRCVRCEALMGRCSCWEPVTLRCPVCKKEKQVMPTEGEKPNAIIMLKCLECWDVGEKAK